MAPPASAAHARSHSILLLQRLLNLRDGASPLTLVVDSLEQTARPLLRELYARAQVPPARPPRRGGGLTSWRRRSPRPRSCSPPSPPSGSRAASTCWCGPPGETSRRSGASWRPSARPRLRPRRDRASRAPRSVREPPPGARRQREADVPTGAVVVVDSLNSLAAADSGAVTAFLSGILTPAVSIVAVYHADVPVEPSATRSEYEPASLTVLSHLATAVLRLSSLQQEVERKRARDRALQEPEWGLREAREGVVVGLRAAAPAVEGRRVVVDMELRRRSGRTVSERLVLAPARAAAAGRVSLLADHAMFAAPGAGDGGGGDEAPESTFDLGLTEKQRRDRDAVVLPYFDAQTDIGAGEGGRILYDMGREDDFDEEEDEI